MIQQLILDTFYIRLVNFFVYMNSVCLFALMGFQRVQLRLKQIMENWVLVITLTSVLCGSNTRDQSQWAYLTQSEPRRCHIIRPSAGDSEIPANDTISHHEPRLVSSLLSLPRTMNESRNGYGGRFSNGRVHFRQAWKMSRRRATQSTTPLVVFRPAIAATNRDRRICPRRERHSRSRRWSRRWGRDATRTRVHWIPATTHATVSPRLTDR